MNRAMDELTRAKKKALFLLTDMDRSEKELYDKLKKSGYSEPVIAETMEYVKGFGYIDDRKYAAHYLESYLKRRSRTRVRFDLEKKGISKEIIEEALESLGEIDQKDLIREIAVKKLHSLHADDERRAEKTAAALARQGFSSADIRSVLEDLGVF